MRTAGALLRSNSLVRSHCRVCGALLRIDLASLVARHGADWNLIDRRERCAMVGCAGSSVYLASWTYGRAWRVLSSDDGGSATVAATGEGDVETLSPSQGPRGRESGRGRVCRYV